ncbi:MAG: tetraacyldisaccharide 4'-kinase [Candidatus Ratteibacteria bacterium]
MLLFFPLSLLYFLFITIKKIFTRKNRVKCKVISVGNILVGGTGKTTLIKYILQKIPCKKKVCLVSKGYGIKKDEILLMKRNFPSLFINEDKSLKGIKKVENQFDLILIDDGFHCLWIKKDIDILLIDFSNPFDNNLLIPAGFLREPKTEIKRCDVIILTHPHMVDLKKRNEILNFIKRYKKPVFLMKFILKNIENKTGFFPCEILKNKILVAFSGIGNPFNFFYLLLEVNPEKIYCIPFPDHYPYKEADLKDIEFIAKEKNADYIITTEKDYVKIKYFDFKIPLFFLNIDVLIEKTDGIDFDSLIEKIIKL